ncbi:MAG: response regulator, partial [bacterium]
MDEQNLLKPKILCVDDEDNVLEILKIELEKDFNILTANSAVQALEILANNTDTAIVISDQKMPGKEGTDFLSEIEQKYPEAVRIILTGYPEYEISYKAIKDGKVYDFIVKKAAYLDEVKKCMVKAMEWYNVQREMRRLKRCVRQLEGFDLIQLLPGGSPVDYEINGALIIDCPKEDP